MFKNAKVVMLPTNDKATKQSILLQFNKLIQFETDKDCLIWNDKHFGDCNITNQHLYIVSNAFEEVCKDTDCMKVIATTDKEISIRRGQYNIGEIGRKIIIPTETVVLPNPSNSFIKKYIEEYNKGHIITDVLVEYEEWCNCNGSIKMRKHLRTTKCDKYIEWEELKINPKDNSLNICFID